MSGSEPRVLYAKCEALYVPKCPRHDFSCIVLRVQLSSHIRRRWLGGPPVPIPNTEVKRPYAESTWLETAWEVRELPVWLTSAFCGRSLYGGRGEVVNTLDCGSSTHGFDPHRSPHIAGV